MYVTRLLVYNGPREWVLGTLARSIQGELVCGGDKSILSTVEGLSPIDEQDIVDLAEEIKADSRRLAPNIHHRWFDLTDDARERILAILEDPNARR